MIKRITTNWTITRVIYLAIGLWIISQGIASHQYFGAVLGVYFASMGLFAFGCAAGNCGYPMQNNSNINNVETQDITYEEVK